MSEETKQSIFGHGSFDEDDSTYLKFTSENKNTVMYKMLEDEPVTKPNKFDKPQHTFEVMCLDTKRVMSHSITSKRYMRALEQHTPLAGKSFAVERIGELMETDYIVKLIQ